MNELQESRYFGSDLNKFVNERCTKHMTVNNIDLIMCRVYADRIMLMIIESKHVNESLGTGQYHLLNLLSQSAPLIGKAITAAKGKNTIFDVFIIYGNSPYERVRIVRPRDRKEVTIDQQTLIKFLEFEVLFDELAER